MCALVTGVQTFALPIFGRTREDREAVVEAVREGTQESDLSRHMIRDQEIQLADERRFDRREIGDVENKVAKACDRGVARREPVAKMGIGVELEMQPAAGIGTRERRSTGARRGGEGGG